jgi:hypothetical protein
MTRVLARSHADDGFQKKGEFSLAVFSTERALLRLIQLLHRGAQIRGFGHLLRRRVVVHG